MHRRGGRLGNEYTYGRPQLMRPVAAEKSGYIMDLLGLKSFEFLLLLADGSLKVQVGAVVAIFVQLQRRIVQLKQQATFQKK